MIDPKLETLLTVRDTGSFTRAAEVLSLTQPAVSQHVRQLERELGVRLFNRGEGGLKATPEGEIALKYAARIKALYQNMEQGLQDARRQIARLAVGVTHSAESNLIAEVLARYCNENPGVHLTLLSDSINNLYAKLKTYEIDLAFIEGRVVDERFSSVLLDTDCLMLMVSKSSRLAKKHMVTLEELKKENMILRLPDSATRNLFVSHLESNSIGIDEFNVVLEVDNIATIKDLVRRNFGVSVMAKSTCLPELNKGKLIALPVENLSMIREINLIYHRDFTHTDILNAITRLYFEASREGRG